jgi:hypothetical protein
VDDPAEAKRLGMPNPFLRLDWDFRLAPDAGVKARKVIAPSDAVTVIWRVRRVLTGHDADGRSTFIADGEAPNLKEMASMPGLALTDLWETGAAPATNGGDKDAAARPVRLEPPKNGTLLRIVEFPPDSAWRGSADGGAAFKSIGAGHAQDRSSSDPMMHKTSTVDYIIVLKGEIHAIMENRREAPARRRHPRPARHQPLLERARQRSASSRVPRECTKPMGASKRPAKKPEEEKVTCPCEGSEQSERGLPLEQRKTKCRRRHRPGIMGSAMSANSRQGRLPRAGL